MNFATLPQATKVLELAKTVESNQLQKLLETGILADVLNARRFDRDEIRTVLGLDPADLPMPYDPQITELGFVDLPGEERSIAQQVNDTAKWSFLWSGRDADPMEDFSYKAIKELFELTLPSGSRELVVAHFDQHQSITNGQLKRWVYANGYEFALIDDLLAVARNKKCRNFALKEPRWDGVVALGSVASIYGMRKAVALKQNCVKTVLEIVCYNGSDWHTASSHFLLVRKPK
ncbi:MAG: hypothetical protein K8Q97_00825 [Candidatus Andersenbacteria bacterium]|nr:hypothetical protein [Candidatus Andersenbacteria bacterium]